MAKRDKVTVPKINPYEIAKADDIDSGFQSFIENTALLADLIVQSNRDFIVGGQVVPGVGLSVVVKPFIAFCKENGMLYAKRTDTVVELYHASAVADRRDVITVSGQDWELFQKERRAKWYVTPNPPAESGAHNDGIAFGEFYKRQSQMVEVNAIQGVDHDATAPNTANGQIKIAEIIIRADRTLLDSDDIYGVSAAEDGQINKGWTAEKESTFSVVTVSDAIRRFLKIHNTDGTLKEGVVGKKNLALSQGDAVTGDDMAIGRLIEKKAERFNAALGEYEPIVPITGNDTLSFKILPSTKTTDVLEHIIDALVRIWTIFIASDKALYKNLKGYTDDTIEGLSQVFQDKLHQETVERQAADEAEKTAREEAITSEAAERQAADEAERTAREEAITSEAAERQAADEAERTAREEAITSEAVERQAADEAEKTARIEGDKRVEGIAKRAISLSAPVGSVFSLYDEQEHRTFLKLDGSTFDPHTYPEFYDYWKKHLAIFGSDEAGMPYLPLVKRYDESCLGQIAVFIGSEYHHGFLEANGLPFSPYVYEEFYEHYWKKYYSDLGKDPITNWPLRPHIANTTGITKAVVYIRVLPYEKYEYTYPYIKTGEKSGA